MNEHTPTQRTGKAASNHTNVRLTDQEREWLDELALEMGLSRSDVLRDGIRELKAQQFRRRAKDERNAQSAKKLLERVRRTFGDEELADAAVEISASAVDDNVYLRVGPTIYWADDRSVNRHDGDLLTSHHDDGITYSREAGDYLDVVKPSGERLEKRGGDLTVYGPDGNVIYRASD